VFTPAKQTGNHKLADSGSSISLTSCTCSLPGICPGQMFTVSLDWLNGLRNGLGDIVWWAMELYGTPEEKARTL
jgi:hypothetical protein